MHVHSHTQSHIGYDRKVMRRRLIKRNSRRSRPARHRDCRSKRGLEEKRTMSRWEESRRKRVEEGICHMNVEKEPESGRFGLSVLFGVKWRGSRTGQIYDRYRSYGQRATFTPATITRHYRD